MSIFDYLLFAFFIVGFVCVAYIVACELKGGDKHDKHR